jgi:hypothetical protein
MRSSIARPVNSKPDSLFAGRRSNLDDCIQGLSDPDDVIPRPPSGGGRNTMQTATAMLPTQNKYPVLITTVAFGTGPSLKSETSCPNVPYATLSPSAIQAAPRTTVGAGVFLAPHAKNSSGFASQASETNGPVRDAASSNDPVSNTTHPRVSGKVSKTKQTTYRPMLAPSSMRRATRYSEDNGTKTLRPRIIGCTVIKLRG